MGRLLRKNLKTVYVFDFEEKDDIYVGTNVVPTYSHLIECDVYPAENRLNAEVYGERVYSMLSLTCAADAVIDENNAVSFTDNKKPTHRVISSKKYTDHKIIVVEAKNGF